MEQEIVTINDQVKDLAVKSGTPFELVVEDLRILSEKANAIESVDDPEFKEIKKEMVAKRKYIKEYCLDARRGIKKVAEGISGVENQLYDIFVPSEERLTEMAKADKEKKLRAEREAVLPIRKEKLATIGDSVEVEDEALLEMDEAAFNEYFMQRQQDKIDADKAEIEAKQKEQEEKEAALEREKEAREREEKARQEERERAAQEAKEKEEREAREKEEAEKREKEEAERKEREEAEAKAKRERADRYKAFREEHGWTEEAKDDFFESVKQVNGVDSKVVLFKKVGEFDLTELN